MANFGGGDEIQDDGDFEESAPILKSLVVPGTKYEYLDHTADVQIHAWGDTLQEAFEQAAEAMFGYMTDIKTVEFCGYHTIEAEGEDLESLLFHFLDEFLFIFSAEPFFIPRKVEIKTFDTTNFKIEAVGHGEPFDLGKHPQGTEVKAITYSNMQIYDEDDKHEEGTPCKNLCPKHMSCNRCVMRLSCMLNKRTWNCLQVLEGL